MHAVLAVVCSDDCISMSPLASQGVANPSRSGEADLDSAVGLAQAFDEALSVGFANSAEILPFFAIGSE